VSGVVAAGGGDAGVPGWLEDGDGEVAQGGHARRILINLALRDADRRTRHKAELAPPPAGIEADQEAARALREIDDLAEFRWGLTQLPARQRAVLVLRYWADLPPGFSQVISIPIQPRQHPVKVTINPAAMPAGTKLSFGHFQLATSQQT
jgi:hypothetical protein